MNVRDIVAFPFRQVSGAWSNFQEAVGEFELADLLPAWLPAALVYIRDSVPRSLGFAETPGDQLTALVTLTVTMVVASATLLTAVAAVYAAVFAPLAVLRLLPAVERRWPLDEGSWPLWRVR